MLVEALPLPLPEPVATAVYGIVSEAVRNAQRHSGAPTCRVAVERDPDGLTVRVTDPGRGVVVGTPAGVGMLSMRERAEGIGGVCVIGPAPDGGTEVTVRVSADRLRPVDGDRPPAVPAQRGWAPVDPDPGPSAADPAPAEPSTGQRQPWGCRRRPVRCRGRGRDEPWRCGGDR